MALPTVAEESRRKCRGTRISAAKCDGCHTTGAKAMKEDSVWKTPEKEKWLGITCERCHGPGSKHAELQTKESIVNPIRLNAFQQNQVCGQCHSRVTSKKDGDLAYPLDFLPGDADLQGRVEFWTYSTRPANFWPNGDSSKNRQQYHDAIGTMHTQGGIPCITCHDSHAPTPGGESLRIAADGTCTQCHFEAASMFDASPMAKAGVKCTDCHMARIAQPGRKHQEKEGSLGRERPHLQRNHAPYGGELQDAVQLRCMPCWR